MMGLQADIFPSMEAAMRVTRMSEGERVNLDVLVPEVMCRRCGGAINTAGACSNGCTPAVRVVRLGGEPEASDR
jgi:hypothetical protein